LPKNMSQSKFEILTLNFSTKGWFYRLGSLKLFSRIERR
jgi:hypothetical protein